MGLRQSRAANTSEWIAVESGEHFEQEAKRILAKIGFTDIRDGPVQAHYDLVAVRQGKKYYVEVKGSLSEKLGVTFKIQAGKLLALSRIKNVLFLFIAGKVASRWKLVEFEELKELWARVRLYSGDVNVRMSPAAKTVGASTGTPLGRPRTLLGTSPVVLRLDRRVVDLLDNQADEEGLSRQVLVTRILADAVRNRSGPPKDRA